jgi:uncharacterized alpha-E superfamily protein
MPRSIAASSDEVVQLLNSIARRTGRQGEADRLARVRQLMLGRSTVNGIIGSGLHEFLRGFIVENARLDQAISQQFRFH